MTSEVPTARAVLDAQGVADAIGIIPADTIVGGILHPNGAQVEAYEATRAVANLSRRQGVDVRERLPVT